MSFDRSGSAYEQVPRLEAEIVRLRATLNVAVSLLREAKEVWECGCECNDPAVDGCWLCETKELLGKEND